jgi:hypothetical protein
MRFRPKTRSDWTKIVPLVLLAAALATSWLHGATPSPPASKAALAKGEKVDPVAVNGPIFEGWPKPDVALVFTAEQDGYLEPCGCTGLENQKGGLKRRFTMLKQLRDKGWPLIVMDAGGQEKNTGKQAYLKGDFSYKALLKMGYDVIGFGENDLKLEILSIVLNAFNPDAESNPLVSANVAILDFKSGFSKRYKIINRGGMKIGITTVLGKKAIGRLQNVADVELKDPKQGIPEIVAELVNAKCDHLVLIANADPDEAKDLARHFKEFNFDWVLATHGAEIPPEVPAKIDGTNSYLIEVGHKGMYAVVVGFYKNGNPSFRYQRVPIDHRFADAPEIYQMQKEYQHELQVLDLDGLGLKPTLTHQSGGKYVGSKTCEGCHTKAAEVYGKTPHSHATETLAKRTDPPRMHDPECLACHVTGWHPQRYFPFETGYLNMKDTPDLVGNGCENCHGPADKHAAAENGDIEVNDTEREKLRAELRLKIVANEGNKDGQEYDKGKVVQMCMQCHDQDNSPDFDFQKYWPKVKHVGKD